MSEFSSIVLPVSGISFSLRSPKPWSVYLGPNALRISLNLCGLYVAKISSINGHKEGKFHT